ncbi:MAG: hypothetical protein NVS4B8_18500 [Herpetosiphon sp.]
MRGLKQCLPCRQFDNGWQDCRPYTGREKGRMKPKKTICFEIYQHSLRPAGKFEDPCYKVKRYGQAI